jgi:hypothetical protein
MQTYPANKPKRLCGETAQYPQAGALLAEQQN